MLLRPHQLKSCHLRLLRCDRRVNDALTQPIPHLPLLVPVKRFGDGADVGFFDRVTALGGPGQEEDVLLDVGGEVV